MSKRTLFLIFALFIITAVLLVLALYKPSAPKTIQTAIVPKEPIAQTMLSFGNPSIATSSSASTLNYSLPINIATGKNKVTAVQLELQYEPNVLTNVTVTPGSFFKNPSVLLSQIDAKTGRISYAFGVGLKDKGVVGKGVAATLTFEAGSGAPRQTAILFLPKTLATAQGVTQSVLKQTNSIQLIVGEKNSSSSAQ